MWIYKNKILTIIPEGAVGFVYKITRLNIDNDTSSPMYYIGKKNFWSGKGKKIIESDWKKYYGSSVWLKTHTEKYGEDCFIREILRICYSKSEMTYHEVMMQIESDVLRVDKHSIMKKKYYNLNILGKFYKSKEFSKEELKQISEYINTGSEEYQKIYVTNGEETKIINGLVENIDEWLLENPRWVLGNSFKGPVKDKIQVTNGETSIYINLCDEKNFLLDNREWYRGSHVRGIFKCVNNGQETLRIHNSELTSFLENNPDYIEGSIKTGLNPYIHIYNNELNLNMYVRKNDVFDYITDGWEQQVNVPTGMYIWVCKDYKEKKINRNEISDYIADGWVEGRLSSANKNKLCITDGIKNRYINVDEQIPIDWYYGSTQQHNYIKRRYAYNTLTGHLVTIIDTEFEKFLLDNPVYVSGKNYSNSMDKVFAINMETFERCEVTKEEFEKNNLLTTMKTKKVKIKKKNRIIFTGYLYIYLRDNNNIPERFFKDALKSTDGIVRGKTKQFSWIESEELFITYI